MMTARGLVAQLSSMVLSVVIASLAIVGQTRSVSAATLHVPGSYATIQSAIDAAMDGDTVLVSAGTYHENIDFLGKGIEVKSESGSLVTTIQGDGIDQVVTMTSGEPASAILDGFTITGGFGDFNGGGVEIEESAPTIRNNIITGNTACTGGGISARKSGAIIEHNVITDNHQAGCFGGTGGGGVFVGAAGTPIIRGNVITFNSMGSNGGGLSINAAGDIVVENNLIAYNIAGSTGGGGGVQVVNRSELLLRQNVIHHNEAPNGEGGGIRWLIPSQEIAVAMASNTIVDNESKNAGSQVWLRSLTHSLIITDNIFSGGTGVLFQCDGPGVTPIPSYNLAFGGTSLYGGLCSDPTGTNGNLSGDPSYSNALAGNYHIHASSPAVDQGVATPYLTATDFDGLARSVDGDGNSVAVVDIGADEWNPDDADLDGIPDGDDACRHAPGPPEYHGCPEPPPVGGQVHVMTDSGGEARALPLMVATIALAATAYAVSRRIIRR